LREDSRVGYFSLAIFVITFLFSLRLAFWPGADDFSWEMDWRGLDKLDQAWIAAAVYTKGVTSKLEERGEMDLFKGYNRRERRRHAYVELAILPVLIGLTILVPTGVLPHAALGWPLVAYGIFEGGAHYVREYRAKSAYRAAQELSPALT
jgi:hypothetical protein